MTAPSTTLIDTSVDVIKAGQSPAGAYVASPTFSQYGYGWLRDGAYCALAMDAAGERESAAQFHAWAAAVITREKGAIEQVVSHLEGGNVPPVSEMLPTRYTLAGEREPHESDEAWPNFQLDGYGTWLFALDSHFASEMPPALVVAAELAARYLLAAWRLPCFDYWEEFGDRQHTSTLASIAAGFEAAARITGDSIFAAERVRVMDVIDRDCVSRGAFVKGPQDDRVDASLISLATPFRLVDVDDPRMAATVQRIRTELTSETGGVRRYVGDTYYGGSPWLLLTAWLGWHLRRCGDLEGFEAARSWVEGQADSAGLLPEQSVKEPQVERYVAEWTERWGPAAHPLLWSHAKYILMLEGDTE